VRGALFANEDPLEQEMRVHDVSCRVVGILNAKGTSAFGQDHDDVIFMPFSTFSRRIVGNDRVGQIMAAALSSDRIDTAKEEITTILVDGGTSWLAKKTTSPSGTRAKFRPCCKPSREF
jgi:putative ABC transport system permease protein